MTGDLPTYYDLLGVSITASTEEIQAACDHKYEQWHFLVSHHDQAVRHEAEAAIQTIERIRSTLLDPARRGAYDAGGVSEGIVGGVADPMGVLHRSHLGNAPPQPRTLASTESAGANRGTSLWACPKCQAENPANTKFCFKCGTQLVRTCPECNHETSLVATGMCGNCGYDYSTAVRRLGLQEDFQARQVELRGLINDLNVQSEDTQSLLDEAMNNIHSDSGLLSGWFVLIFGGVVILLAGGGALGGNGLGLVVLALAVAVIPGAAGLVGAYRYRRHWREQAVELSTALGNQEDERHQLQDELTSLETSFQAEWAATERERLLPEGNDRSPRRLRRHSTRG